MLELSSKDITNKLKSTRQSLGRNPLRQYIPFCHWHHYIPYEFYGQRLWPQYTANNRPSVQTAVAQNNCTSSIPFQF